MQRSICLAAAMAALFMASQLPAGAQLATARSGAAPASPRASGGANLGSGQLTAFVTAAGPIDLGRSKGASCTASCRASQGRYAVKFARNLDGCTATISTDQYVLSSVYINPGSDQIDVTLANGALSAYVDSDFMLHVIC